MFAEMIDKILGVGEADIIQHDGISYKDEPANRTISRLKMPEQYEPKPRYFQTLLGLYEFFKSEGNLDDMWFHVENPSLVSLNGLLDPANDNTRFCFAKAESTVNQFEFGRWMDLEMFIINLQSRFNPTETVSQLIDMLGALANENIIENKDDGFSQSVQIKTGISTKSQVKIKNPVTLTPYRTFMEVSQPPSQMIFRIKKTNGIGILCSLWVADGGVWELQAIENINKWLVERSGGVVIG